MKHIVRFVGHLGLLVLLMLPGLAAAQTISKFEGSYAGEAEFVFEDQVERRDMSTTITATKAGFTVSWTSVSYKSDERAKTKTYTIEFAPSSRGNIYKSKMKNNLFGKATPLDPLEGEPFVWARLDGDTLSVFSLFINEVGGYEMQEYHRTLVSTGLELEFRRIQDGRAQKEIRTTLRRID